MSALKAKSHNKLYMHKVKSCLKLFDRYGSVVSLTFNDDTKFKTAFGGLLSITSWIIIASYLIYLTNDVYNYKFSINSSSKQRDVIRDSTIINVKDNFDVAF